MMTDATTETATTEESPRGRWRFRIGATILVAGFAAPLAIPLVTSSELPAGWKTAISGGLAVGVPEVMMLLAAAVMGKEGFAELKRRIGRFFRRYGPPDAVGPTRHRIGLSMFLVPLVLGWLGPYLGGRLPAYDRHPVFWHVGGDLLFVTSLFVLGGDFWDKVRALFVHGARAVFPGEGGTDA
jgi:hypothetical protein